MGKKSIWFVVFTPTEQPRWWNKFLKPNFHHCFCFTEHNGTWVSIETLLWRTEIQLVEDSLYRQYKVNGMLEWWTLNPNNTVVMIETDYVLNSVPRIVPLTCVSVVESMLGLRGHSWTPYRLYKRLMREKMGKLLGGSAPKPIDNSEEIAAAKKREEAAADEKRQQQEDLIAERKSKSARGASGSLFSTEEDDDTSPFLGIPKKTKLG